MKRLILILAAFLFAAGGMSGQQAQELPNDPATRTGKLDNGMTYYIRHNDKPEQRAEFYLATNAGAVQEAPDQDGLAHFLEHMCFNGTKNFPGKGLLNWLESIGASFGGNVNASTGIEQTIYMLNNIPLCRPGVVDSCILIMHDYSHFVTCDPKEIDAERGVIIEEKRTRNTAGWRNFMSLKKYLYKGTPYADVSIIGEQEQLETFKPESLVNFYRTWYRPDNQALIVVGDIDVDAVESKIKDIFSDIPAPENPRAKDVIKVPDNAEPIIGIITDPETVSSSVEVFWKSEAFPEYLNSTTAGLVTDLVKAIISTVMNERFSAIAAKPGAPFISADLGIYNAMETMDVVNGTVSNKDEEILPAFEALMMEIEKMKRFGFTDSEVERAKSELLSRYESAANKADTRKNAEFVNPIINHFFDNKSFMEPAAKLQVVQMIMPQLGTAMINQITTSAITDSNMVVIYCGPSKEGLVNPTEEELSAILTKVKKAEIEKPAGEEIPEAFLDPTALKGGKVKSSGEFAYGSEILELSNGMKVVLLPKDCEKDKISIDIFKKGGESLISDEELYSFESNVWSLFRRNSGVAGFSSTTVDKMLAGKQVYVNPYINTYTHGISATSTVKDIETAFQLAYLLFTRPRFDTDEYNRTINQLKAVLPNFVNQPNYKMQEAMYKTVYDSPRCFVLSEDVLGKASLNTMSEVYGRLFKDVAGATAVITGDFRKEDMLPLVTKYLGSLPKGKKTTDWKYCGDGEVDGKKICDFKAKMEAPKVSVLQLWKTDKPYSVEAEVAYKALEYILDMIYVETLREEEGGTYGASTFADVSNVPHETRVLQVFFDTNAELADKLRGISAAGVKGIADNGPDAEKFDKAVKNLEKNIPENKLKVSYWNKVLEIQLKYGTDYVNEYEKAVSELTPAKIKAAAEELTGSGNFIEVIMRPE